MQPDINNNQQKQSVPRWVIGVIVAQFAVIVVLALHTFPIRLIPVDMKYEDWVSILLTGLGLIISVLGVFLAVLAFVGWQTFDLRVKQRVREVLDEGPALKEALTEGFAVNGNLRQHLQDAVERVSYDIPGGHTDAGDENNA